MNKAQRHFLPLKCGVFISPVCRSAQPYPTSRREGSERAHCMTQVMKKRLDNFESKFGPVHIQDRRGVRVWTPDTSCASSRRYHENIHTFVKVERLHNLRRFLQRYFRNATSQRNTYIQELIWARGQKFSSWSWPQSNFSLPLFCTKQKTPAAFLVSWEAARRQQGPSMRRAR